MTDGIRDPADPPPLAERLAAVREGVADAARRAGRDPVAITTIVVTKFQPVELLRDLLGLGVRDLGESRLQELRQKASEFPEAQPVWHFVGQVQGKKARQVRALSSVIHSVDRDSLVDALERGDVPDDPTPVFLQIDLAGEEGRGGAPEAEVERMTERLTSAPSLELLGVMAVAPLGVEPRAAFARLRALSERVVAIAPGATAISAGMSGDYTEAVLEGATHLRIGTAITGKRPTDG